VILWLAVAAQALDLTTFAGAVARHGPMGEANPVMRAAYETAGLAGVAGVKAATLLLVLLAVHALTGAGAPPWVANTVLVFATLAGLLGALTNALALAR
jgi:hypothetical protein